MPNESEHDRRMLRLAYVAYFGCSRRDPAKVHSAVVSGLKKYTPSQKLVWGPALNDPEPGLATNAMMFVVQGDDEYTVVVRGTNPTSIRSWLLQDFAFMHQKPWSTVSPATEAPLDAMVSDGAYRTMEVHRGLRPAPGLPGVGTTLAKFLENLDVPRQDLIINFTGHSLGGLAAPTMALWVREILGDEPRIRVASFAGPTAGNELLATYSDDRLANGLEPEGCVCFRNELDFAASSWNADALQATGKIYERALKDLALVELAKVFSPKLEKLGYTCLSRNHPIDSSFACVPDGFQVIYQHIWSYARDLLGKQEARRIVKDVAFAMMGLHVRMFFKVRGLL